MLIIRGGNWPEHRRWFIVTLATGVAAALWYGVESARAGQWLGGGSVPGLVLGGAGGLIVVFEMLLWPRKKFRGARVGQAKLWMKAHIWLGLLSAPLLVLHSGFHWWGGSLSSVLMFVFLAVIVSGVWGLALQQVVPKLMLENVPAETIRSQIDTILAQYLEEASRLVRSTCGAGEPETVGASLAGADEARPFLVVGAVRTTGSSQDRFLRTREQARRVPGSEPLLAFFEETVSRYLAAASGSGSPLASAKRAGAIFKDIRTRLDPAAHEVVDRLEDLCDRRRQFDLQARLHGWLHGWLYVHVPLSVAVFLLMIAHVYFAIRYL